MQVQNCGTYSFYITKAVKHIYGNRDVFRRVTVCRLLPTFLPLSADSFSMPFSERPPAFGRVSSRVRSYLVPRSVVPRPAFTDKYRDCNKKPYLPPVLIRVAGRVFYSVNCFMNSSSLMMGMFSSCAFLFFDDIEAVSLLIRKLVDLLTLPVTFPPWLSM